MASAQVKIQDLKNGINACGVCTHELQLTTQQLQRDYMSAGSGWKDEQYKNLGQIVEDSCTAILQPIPQLENCQKWLQELADLVEKYETCCRFIKRRLDKMAMNASVSAIQDMEKTLADTVRNLDTLSEKISTNFRPSADWNDNQAVAYNQVMQKIARLVKSPTADLKKQQEKLKQLEELVRSYQSHQFNG